MKRIVVVCFNIYIIVLSCFCGFCVVQPPQNAVFAKSELTASPKLVIVIDDFGSFDRSGVKTMLSIEAPLTCAIMPNLDYSLEDMTNATQSGKEVILHMPMESHVPLPADWYGPVYIYNSDMPETAVSKLEKCLKTLPDAKGFNVHIGSGVSQNSTLMKAIIDYAKVHGLCFLDSRTHINTICEKVSAEESAIYLGRDEFLEPDHNKSYAGVKKHLENGIKTAKEKGYAIVIGHVGAHGGENTANAIKDMIETIKKEGVEIVPLSTLFSHLKAKHVSNDL